jgi:hypothetical protein
MTDVATLPRSAYPPCLDCGQPVDPEHPLSLREVVGFARRREQGGQNHVLHRSETGRWLCVHCSRRRARGIPIEQGTLV